MTREGTVVNGVIVPDGPLPFPEGARVRFLVEDDADLWDEPAAGPPPATETREEFLESLRQSVADIKAGRGIPAAEAFAELKREFGVPPDDADAVSVPHVRYATQDRLTADDF